MFKHLRWKKPNWILENPSLYTGSERRNEKLPLSVFDSWCWRKTSATQPTVSPALPAFHHFRFSCANSSSFSSHWSLSVPCWLCTVQGMWFHFAWVNMSGCVSGLDACVSEISRKLYWSPNGLFDFMEIFEIDIIIILEAIYFSPTFLHSCGFEIFIILVLSLVWKDGVFFILGKIGCYGRR